MAYLTILGFTLALLQLGYGAIITTQSSTIIINPDEHQTIELPCMVTYEGATSQYAAESVYSQQAAWKKQQADGPEVDIATLLQLSPDFSSFITMEPANTFYQDPYLNMKMVLDLDQMTEAGYDVTAASGNYTCHLPPSSQSNARPPPAPITHEVKVIRPISMVQMIGGFNPLDNMTWTTSMMYYADRNGYFSCETIGSYPMSSLTITVDGEGITGSDMTHTEDVMLTGETPGLQAVETKSHTWSDTVKFEKDDDTKIIKCEAKVSVSEGGNSEVIDNKDTEAELIVYFAPQISCEFTSINNPAVIAAVGDENTEVQCKIAARPVADNIAMTMKGSNSNTAIAAGTRNDTLKIQFSVSAGTDQDTQVATILFEQIQDVHFAQYELTAENIVGHTLQSFEIRKGEVYDGASSSVRALISMMSLPLLVLMLLFHPH